MGGDDYAHDNAAIHPLYRLAGVNLDFKKLFRLGVCGLRDEALRLSKETQESEKKEFLRGRSFCAGILRRVMGQYITEAKRLAGQENDRVRQQELLQMAECLETFRLHHRRVCRRQFSCNASICLRRVQ